MSDETTNWVNNMTPEQREQYDKLKAEADTEGAQPLTDQQLQDVHGGLTFRETKWDRFRLWNYAFWNGEIGVMADIMGGKPLSEISWRP